MATFLRDKQISNVTVDEAALRGLMTTLQLRGQAKSPNANTDPDDQCDDDVWFVYAVIRFDNRGYRVHSTEELVHCFRQARTVERIVLQLETGQSIKTGRITGTYIDLRLDAMLPTNCVLQVTSDNRDWVDASFGVLEEAVDQLRNKHGWLRSGWTEGLIQLAGVMLGFLVSLWAAVVISPRVDIENAFIIVFLFALVIFSNLWLYLRQLAFSAVNKLFPSITFRRPNKDQIHWLLQAVVGGIVVAFSLSLIHLAFQFVAQEIGRIFSG